MTRTPLLPLACLIALSDGAPAQSVLLDVFGLSGSGAGTTVDALDDIDGDGVRDLVLGCSANCLEVRSGQTGSLIYRLEAFGSFGAQVAAIPDTDGDGVSDILTSNVYTPSSGPYTGEALLYSGATGNLLYSWDGAHGGDYFGQHLASAGDFDGDGFGDCVAAGYRIGDPGYARVFSGATGAMLLEVTGQDSGERLGSGLVSVGDVNGDGFDDLAIGSPNSDAGGVLSGRVQVLAGPSGALLHSFVGNPGDKIGGVLANAGDLDGDGSPELMWRVVRTDLPFSSVKVVALNSGAELFDLLPEKPSLYFGTTMDGPGDVNGDGVGDLLVGFGGDASYDQSSGMGRLYSGADGGQLFSIHGEDYLDGVGRAVKGVGDLDGDGLADVAITSSSWDSPAGSGRLRIFAWAGGAELVRFCSANPTSVGAPSTILASTSGSVSLGNLVLTATSVPQGQFGLFFYGATATQTPLGDGNLCVSGEIYRLGPALEAIYPNQLSRAVVLGEGPTGTGSGTIAPGSTWLFQAWFRDPQGLGAGFNLSDGISITFLP